ncbi:MAG: lipid-A-disaccharide synthase [Alphaproteobacteria bacterium]|nr:lipid-A-disaccharide synthase [Alphaproteobacteria bacterium]
MAPDKASESSDHGPHICIIAGEPSGEHMGAGLLAALIEETGGKVRFSGIGGVEMAKAGRSHGFESFLPMEDLSIAGIFEIIPHIPRSFRHLNETARRIKKLSPDVVVTIDSSAFSFRLGKKLKGGSATLVHYVAPAVWAWRPRRAKMIARFLDHLLMIFPFEAPYFRKWGLACTFIGHPIAEMDMDKGDGPGFRSTHGMGESQPLLCVLPGSRQAEVKRLLPVFSDVLARLKRDIPDLAVVVPTVATVADTVRAATASWPVPVTVTEGMGAKRDAFAASHVALAASGTVTSELTVAGVPMVIVYRLAWLSALVIRLMIKIPYVSVVNLALGREIAPEFLQGRCRADLITGALLPLMLDPDARRNQIEGLAEVAEIFKGGDKPSSQQAAEVILQLVADKNEAD